MTISQFVDKLEEIKAADGDIGVFVGDMDDMTAEHIRLHDTINEEDSPKYGSKYLHIGDW